MDMRGEKCFLAPMDRRGITGVVGRGCLLPRAGRGQRTSRRVGYRVHSTSSAGGARKYVAVGWWSSKTRESRRVPVCYTATPRNVGTPRDVGCGRVGREAKRTSRAVDFRGH
ncbi:unnamed protein product [Ectocarpus sp. CCAP 1310/34]|nr:unnamed protein product [Ectocarpus sp. CCAP 1310/34]